MMEEKSDTTDTMQSVALALFSSLRGKYLISQALHYGIQELDKIPHPYKENSNMVDMQLLRDELFNFYIGDTELSELITTEKIEAYRKNFK